jgi:response regulator RpfG family c-di-GMP phosphodiesterase
MDPATDPLGKTVLLVDSNQNVAEARARVLRRYGVTVVTVDSAKGARALIDGNTYHLILVAPRGNPAEAIQLQREIKRLHPEQRVAFFVGPPKYISFTYGQTAVPMPARRDTWADRLKGHLASA